MSGIDEVTIAKILQKKYTLCEDSVLHQIYGYLVNPLTEKKLRSAFVALMARSNAAVLDICCPMRVNRGDRTKSADTALPIAVPGQLGAMTAPTLEHE